MNNFNKRADGRIEWICEDGIGHTIYEPEFNNRSGRFAYAHGCDGCCSDINKDDLMKLYMEQQNNE